ncbi:MAG: 5'-methylthioadenosine/adenosylhomocysteine nucleosidase [Bacilli bacterium]|nr:5'-methylthioadenosine/adenosylhomocysteine nucleosidase [Bacilli bacterium]
MKIGIIFAMKEELDALLKVLTLVKEYKIFDLTFYECELNNKQIVLVESGIGKVNSARTTQILIDNMKVDYIFNIGVAGGIDEKVSVCDIVIGKKLVQHDFDITPFDHEKGYIPNVGVYLNSDEYLINLAKDIKTDSNVYVGTIASGDIFVNDSKMSNKINTKFNALCCEMEGASIAQVCYLSHIPFLVIRSISDSVNGNNELTYNDFLLLSSKMVAKFMIDLLNRI